VIEFKNYKNKELRYSKCKLWITFQKKINLEKYKANLMTKKQLKKAIYTSIFIEGKSHLETFEKFRGKSKLTPDELADEVAKTPNRQKHSELLNLRISFIIALCLVIILRIIGIYVLTIVESLPISVFLLSLIFGIAIPILGIFAAMKGRVDMYFVVGIFLVLGALRSFTKDLDTNNLVIIGTVLIPLFVAVILAFYIPKKMKIKFTKKVVSEATDGGTNKKLVYHFESSQTTEDLLDGELQA
tara:strand:+ start:6368 stop:7096 length:729 start_codon:yes stop_codon:yes gene_type:complete